MGRTEKIRKLVFASIICLVIAILGFIPSLGYITIGPIAFTIVHIPVLIGAVVLGAVYGSVFGLVFGMTSLVMAFITQGVNLPWTNPLLSVLPRILLGFSAGLLADLFRKKIKLRLLACGLAMGISYSVTAIIILTALYFVVQSNFYFLAKENPMALDQTFFKFVYGAFVGNTLLELAAALVVGLPVVFALGQLDKPDPEEPAAPAEEEK